MLDGATTQTCARSSYQWREPSEMGRGQPANPQNGCRTTPPTTSVEPDLRSPP